MQQESLEDQKIKAVNEIYHDLEAELYVQRHPEIFVEEQATWEMIGEKFLKTSKPLTVLDIGTGTGFVPMLVSRYLKANDRVICTDISAEMLKVTERKMAGFNQIKKEFIKADALQVSQMNLKVDVITMNSVLHHIPDYELVLTQINKMINPGGLFIVMHERNKLYAQNKSKLLKLVNQSFQSYIGLRKLAKKVLVSTGLYHKKSQWQDFNERVYLAINAKKLSDQELTIDDINAMVDVHDPDERGEGFDPFELHQKFFPNFEIVSINTYKHLGPWIEENKGGINKLIARKIRQDSPHAGALFWLIVKKT